MKMTYLTAVPLSQVREREQRLGFSEQATRIFGVNASRMIHSISEIMERF